jgi:glycosyltransferase involved in cell wall biosynthesis
MLRRRFYYLIKPIVPRWLRMEIRRVRARRMRKIYQDVWPITESAAREPAGWPGWPEGKDFAFVLTHDVERAGGLSKCRQLAELEMEHGVRSSFNFVPEGDYEVPQELIDWLTENGFEVGVHDLKHNGKLYQSRTSFLRSAVRINQHIRSWKASGFRSGFMLRNLDWIHDLDIQYDASTFDTDPFEPQPDGTGTIFPFWIPSPTSGGHSHEGHSVTARSRGGYVELPYTLAQDSTLFLILGEKTAAIWTQKVDWIAKHRGMALLNVHPDYIDFDNPKRFGREFGASAYADLLKHVSQNYSGRYWNPLPKDLVSWFKGVSPSVTGTGTKTVARNEPVLTKHPNLRGKRVAVLLYSNYPFDPRPRRAAEALVEEGVDVEVICLRENEEESAEEVVRGVKVRRLPIKRRRGGKLEYIWQYASFLLGSFFILGWRGSRKRYDLVHVHNMPDVLAFSALVPRLKGAKVILDLHDPMPELMRTIFDIKESSVAVSTLKRLEKWSIGFSDAVLTVNEACKKIFSARSCSREKITVIMNSPDEKIFKYREITNLKRATTQATVPFVIMYHGSIVERHGLDLAVLALGSIRKTIPGAELRIYGQSTPFLEKVMNSVQGTELNDAVRYFGAKTLDQIVEAIGECDVGIIPNRRSIFTELNTPTRIFEYLSQSKPVIAPRVHGILDYFSPEELFFFELGNADDLAKQLQHVFREPEVVLATVKRGQKVYLDHTWSNERHRFLDLVSQVLGTGIRNQSSVSGSSK